MGKKTRRRPQVPSGYEGFFSNKDHLLTASMLRGMLGMAIKYVLLENDWNFSGEVELRSYRGADFRAHPNVQPMIDAFRSRDLKQMKEKNDLNSVLKWLVAFEAAIHKQDCKVRVRKSRLKRVAREFRQRLREVKGYSYAEGRGVMLFAFSIRKQFL